jgi:hypothetical protein
MTTVCKEGGVKRGNIESESEILSGISLFFCAVGIYRANFT